MQNLRLPQAGINFNKMGKSLTEGYVCVRCGHIQGVCDCNRNKHNVKLAVFAPCSILSHYDNHTHSIQDLRATQPYANKLAKASARLADFQGK